MATAMKHGRDVKPKAGESAEPDDYPYTMKLPGGKIVYVEIPGRWVSQDRGGETVFLPPAVYLLDRVHVMAMSLTGRMPTPGHIKTLRRTLGLTQSEMAERVGVDKMTVWRWERGKVRPSKSAVSALEKLRKQAARRGVIVEST